MFLIPGSHHADLAEPLTLRNLVNLSILEGNANKHFWPNLADTLRRITKRR